MKEIGIFWRCLTGMPALGGGNKKTYMVLGKVGGLSLDEAMLM